MWGEGYIYAPTPIQKLLAFLLLPLSWLWILGLYLRKFYLLRPACRFTPSLPVISVGNLSLGGSGKTPLCLAIADKFKGGAVVLRGYGRHSKGLVKVSINGRIMASVNDSGDEAMLYAKMLKNSTVIVSKDRQEGIKIASELGAKYVLLDDGFSKFNIKKLDILISPSHPPALPFCLPSGGWRYPASFLKMADLHLSAGKDFYPQSTITNATPKMLLVCAIAQPARLKEHFKASIAQVFYPDHYEFEADELAGLLRRYGATSLLVTRKDWVKIAEFGLPLSILELRYSLSEQLHKRLDKFINKALF